MKKTGSTNKTNPVTKTNLPPQKSAWPRLLGSVSRLKTNLSNLSLKPVLAGLSMALLVSMLLLSGNKTVKPQNSDELASVSVQITNLRQNRGGSGVILSSSNHGSVVLTNRHVCGVVENGGIVKTDNGNLNTVVSYTKSNVHDLCTITVAENLGTGIKLAPENPNYLDSAVIVGHPALLPTTITKGHFSGSQIITLLAEVRKCTKEETEDPALGFFCSAFGALPVFKSFQAQHVTATIMPGSSGSPVFNENGELTGLVFAGMGQLGYAMIVPSDYVRYFLNIESQKLQPTLPSYESGLLSNDASSINKIRASLSEVCQKAKKSGLNTSVVCPDNIISGDDIIFN